MWIWLIIIAIAIVPIIISWRIRDWSIGAVLLLFLFILGGIPAIFLSVEPKMLNGQQVVAIVETKNNLSIFTDDGKESVLNQDEDIIWTHDSETIQTKTNGWLHTQYTLPADKVIVKYDVVCGGEVGK